MSFSDKLVFFRTRYGLSKNELGERMGLSTKVINDWERGKSLPNEGDFQKLSDIFGVKKEFFVEDALTYKNLESFSREDYWGIGLTRLDCEGYIDMAKKASKYQALGISLMFLIPIVLIFVDKFLPFFDKNANILLYKIGAGLILLFLGVIFVGLGSKQKDKYTFVDNGMMYYLKSDDRVFVQNVLDQEKPKCLQKIIFGLVFVILAVIISLNFTKIFGRVGDDLRLLIIILVLVLINVGINFIVNYALRLSNIRKLLKNQNSYYFDDKNLDV